MKQFVELPSVVAIKVIVLQNTFAYTLLGTGPCWPFLLGLAGPYWGALVGLTRPYQAILGLRLIIVSTVSSS